MSFVWFQNLGHYLSVKKHVYLQISVSYVIKWRFHKNLFLVLECTSQCIRNTFFLLSNLLNRVIIINARKIFFLFLCQTCYEAYVSRPLSTTLQLNVNSKFMNIFCSASKCKRFISTQIILNTIEIWKDLFSIIFYCR